tara:strand:- start:12 stop:428 length:417 start_codon:yes stop_codon:yes gene_type:complete
MATKGDVGKIMFHNAGGTEADVSDLRAWNLSVSKDSMETTKMGDTFKSFVGGLITGEGGATLLYNASGDSDYQSFIDDVLTTGDAGDALIELFPDSAQSAKKISSSVIITNAEYSATLGEIEEIAITFITTGTITSAI